MVIRPWPAQILTLLLCMSSMIAWLHGVLSFRHGSLQQRVSLGSPARFLREAERQAGSSVQRSTVVHVETSLCTFLIGTGVEHDLHSAASQTRTQRD